MQNWDVVLDWLDPTNAQTWRLFFLDRQGSYDPFYWFAWYKTTDVGLPVGIGDGSTVTFDLPFKESTLSPLIFVDAALQTDPADYSYSAGTGTNGADEITFTTAPALDEVITATCSGARVAHHVRFKNDSFDTQFRYQDGGIGAQFSFKLEEVISA